MIHALPVFGHRRLVIHPVVSRVFGRLLVRWLDALCHCRITRRDLPVARMLIALQIFRVCIQVRSVRIRFLPECRREATDQPSGKA